MLAAEIMQQETAIIAMEEISLPLDISLEIEIIFVQERIEFLDGLLINIGNIIVGCGKQVHNISLFKFKK